MKDNKKQAFYFSNYNLDPPHGGPCCFLDRDNNI